jgi:hypothetical protein
MELIGPFGVPFEVEALKSSRFSQSDFKVSGACC